MSRTFLAAALLLGGLILIVCFSLTSGSISLTWQEFWLALWHQGNPTHQTIIWQLRLPRVLAALTVGSALGMSGALLQGMLRNGLASPFLLGISSGAGLVAVLMVSLGMWQGWLPLGTWLGGVGTLMIVYGLARTGNSISIQRLILGGVAFSTLSGAVQSMLLLTAREGRVQAALTWLLGSLNGRGWEEVALIGPGVAVMLVLGCFLARQLNLLSLGEDLAMGLGVSLLRSRLLIGAVAAFLAAGAVSIAGLVGFVGLIVPHGIRLMVGTDNRIVLPFSALGGALILSAADLLARIGPIELPVGIVTALLGSPIFIWLLYRRSAVLTGV